MCTKLCIVQKREGNDLIRAVNSNKGIKSQFRSNSLNQDLCYRVKINCGIEKEYLKLTLGKRPYPNLN